ncbi:hypothetical protein BDY19DRAFT_960848 [Irpex rosettiformis]|uniref:Uncharacterized protein n=1 Tax=Irpex rosettiformis TaxID=378272 RepID=A0ACB8TWL0_9APHY|nr:hypothetical protein BDY19DRAFT_960848 [Irpex rosettiformis]
MPPSLYIPILIAGMLITGSSNSLWTKWQDMQCVENCDDPNPRRHVLYEQPVWQTLQMFIGEMFCFLPVLYTVAKARYQAFKRSRRQPVHLGADDEDLRAPTLTSTFVDSEADDAELEGPGPKAAHALKPMRGWAYLLLWLPSFCDLTGTTLLNIGLLYTPVSIYQMTRGASVLFVGILSVMFLHRKLWLYQWLSLVTVMFGVGLVGLSGSMIKDAVKDAAVHLLSNMDTPGSSPTPADEPEVTKVLLGVFLVLISTVFAATQFVVEEKIMSRYSVTPLVAVGWEGFFGAASILVMFPFLPLFRPYVPASTEAFFDVRRGWNQMIHTPTVLWSGIAIMCSISAFNFFGLSMTRHVSSVARSLTDMCRTLTIWIISLLLGWELLVFPISLVQVLGFSLLIYGTFVFNNIVQPPAFLRPHIASEHGDEDRALLANEALDETSALPADLGQSGYDVVPQEQLPQPHPRRD